MRFIAAIAFGLAACGFASAQTTPAKPAPAMKAQELKSALFGIRMEGIADGTSFRWRECVDLKGQTLYETAEGEIRGRLTITAKGKACFAYEDDGYTSQSCFVMRRTARGFHFEGDYGANFTTTKVEGGVRTCEKRTLSVRIPAMADNQTDRTSTFIARLTEALGPKGVSTDAHEIAPHIQDWRGRWHGKTPVLVKPSSTEDVSKAMTLCAEYGLAVNPQGGNSGMVNGSVPDGEVLISLKRMNKVREVDVLNDAMTLEAGVVLTRAQEVADEHGRLFPLSLGAQGVAMIGGLISTNAGGVGVLRYGMMRDLVLGIEAVLPDGRVWNGLRGLRKDNTGYDLKHLFIGAEGTLGVVTAATLKLFPKPAVKETAWVTVETPAKAVELLMLAKSASGGAVTGFEIVPQLGLQLVLKHIPDTRDPLPSALPWRVLVELSLPRVEGARDMMEALLADALEQGVAADAVICETEAQKAMVWKIRENIAVAERAHGKALKHDVSVPVSRVAEFMERGAALAHQMSPGADVIAFGHVGDGNIHFNITPPPGADQDRFVEQDGLPLSKAVHDLIASLNGSISAEHGIGRLKRDELAWRKSAVEMDMMRAVKAALDPQGRMNPGRVL